MFVIALIGILALGSSAYYFIEAFKYFSQSATGSAVVFLSVGISDILFGIAFLVIYHKLKQHDKKLSDLSRNHEETASKAERKPGPKIISDSKQVSESIGTVPVAKAVSPVDPYVMSAAAPVKKETKAKDPNLFEGEQYSLRLSEKGIVVKSHISGESFLFSYMEIESFNLSNKNDRGVFTISSDVNGDFEVEFLNYHSTQQEACEFFNKVRSIID